MHNPPATGDHAGNLLLTLFIMFAAAKVGAELFERLRQPAVAGEILAGVIVGPGVLGWARPGEITDLLAEIGVMFLLFAVGLETRPSTILRVGRTAAFVATLGVAVPFVAGWGLLRAYGAPQIEALFVGAALVATSVGITARALSDMGLLATAPARIILGAAVIDDILGLLVLAAVSSLARGGGHWNEIAATAAMAIGFVAFVTFLGAPFVTRLAPHIRRLRLANALFAIAIVLCLGLALAASAIGVAAIIGAFLAGLTLAEAAEREHALRDQIRGVTEFLAPVFLVNIGMQLDFALFADKGVLLLAAALTAVAVATKFIGCGIGALGLGSRQAMRIGVGMIPRGEVGIVVAQAGLALGVIGERLFAVVLFMAVATTMIAPPLIRLLFRGRPADVG
jgi:Kef-type K+ transport system membrane component KefB